jgi:hypothetical protein
MNDYDVVIVGGRVAGASTARCSPAPVSGSRSWNAPAPAPTPCPPTA